MHVAVLGAGGTIAPAIVHDLARSEEVERLVLLDLDASRAAEVARRHGDGKAHASAVDARDADALAGELERVDVLVNSASYRINLEAMRACLAGGCHYLDLGGLYRVTLRQLELGEEFERAELLAVLGIGSSPGKTNLMAAKAVAELGQRAETIEVCAAGRDPVAARTGAFAPPYALQTLIDELTIAPIVIRSGEPAELEPLSPGGEVEFGEPIGEAETIYTLHSEMATFAESFGCREASFRLSLALGLLERLKALAAGGEPPATVPPSEETVSAHLVRAYGAGGESVAVRAVTRPHFGLGGSIVSTAAPAAACVRLIARGSLQPARGALPPERCISPDEMFAELEQRGCGFSV